MNDLVVINLIGAVVAFLVGIVRAFQEGGKTARERAAWFCDESAYPFIMLYFGFFALVWASL